PRRWRWTSSTSRNRVVGLISVTLGSEGQIMLTAEGCRARRARLLDRLKPSHALVLADPGHLRYFANFHVEAISQHADVGALLVIRPDGHAALFHDSKLPKTVELSHADERTPVIWYSGQEPGDGPR